MKTPSTNLSYYQKNREKLLSKQKEYYRANREKALEYAKEYQNRTENKQKIKDYRASYDIRRKISLSTTRGRFSMGEGI